jgi:thiamine-monophosphate kinase
MTQTVRDVGEFGLIERLRDALPEAARSAPGIGLGIGDDAATWRPPDGASVVVSSDSLVEGIHFRLDAGWSTWADLGHKALAVNLSDLAAMGAVSALATVSLGLRGDEAVADVEAAYRSMGALAARHGCVIAGGDIVQSPRGVLWHVTALGAAARGKVIVRSGARPGDVIVVSGTVGASAAGLELLRLPTDDPRRRATTADLLLAAHLRPEPRIALGQVLLREGATAAMDLSDGLLGDLPKILTASGVAAELDLPSIPVAAAVRALFPDRWESLALAGGEDYELLATLPPDRADRIITAAAALGSPLKAIGTVLPHDAGAPALRLRDVQGHVRKVAPGAWDHFRRA